MSLVGRLVGRGAAIKAAGGAPAPTVTLVRRKVLPTDGAIQVTVTGTNFVSGGGLAVTVGGTAATSVTWVSATTITCTVPAKAAGLYTVRVTNPDAQFGELASGVRYVDPTLWVMASYAGSPWVGKVDSRDLSEATNPPATGTAVNGLTPADFDGTNDILTNATAISTILSAAAWSCLALVNLDAINTNNADLWLNDPIVCDTGAFWGIHLKSAPTVHIFQWDGASKSVSETIATSAWALVQAKYNGANLLLRVNGGSWQAAASGNISTTTGTVRVGLTPTGGHALDGRLAEIMLSNVAEADAVFDDLKADINAIYGLAL
jgi:hypothetical protein